MQRVAARRHTGNDDLSVTIGDPVKRRSQREDHGAHLRMNVAENVRDSDLIETHITGSSCLVESEVETLTVKERKDIVKKRVVIRKLYDRSNRHDQNVRLKAFVQLDQARMLLAKRRRQGLNGLVQRCEPEHDVSGLDIALCLEIAAGHHDSRSY